MFRAQNALSKSVVTRRCRREERIGWRKSMPQWQDGNPRHFQSFQRSTIVPLQARMAGYVGNSI